MATAHGHRTKRYPGKYPGWLVVVIWGDDPGQEMRDCYAALTMLRWLEP